MQGQIQTNPSLNYMTQYRGLAIIMIVMVHCTTRFLSNSNGLFNYIYAFFANSTDIFLFISGFLFEYLLYKRYSYKEFMRKKIKRLIIPYLFWALPVSLVYFVHLGFDFSYLGFTMLTGFKHINPPHWYIPFIFCVFAISPIFSFLQQKKVLYVCFLPVFIFLLLTTERCEENFWFGPIVFFNLIGFFILGMLFSHYKSFLVEKLYHWDWLFLAIGLLIIIYKGLFAPVQPESVLDAVKGYFHGNVTMNWYALNKIFMSIGFLLLFYRLDKNKCSSQVLDKIAHYSFGIYFCHMYFASVLSLFLGRISYIPMAGNLAHLVVCFTAVFLTSILTIYILRKFKSTKNIIGV